MGRKQKSIQICFDLQFFWTLHLIFIFGKKTEKLDKFKTNSCMQFLIIGKVALKPFANF